MPTVYVMCGIHASGKSTIAKKIAAFDKTVILSAEEIRRELFKGQKFDYTQNEATYRMIWNRYYANLTTGKNIVIDDTNLKRGVRMDFIKLAKKKRCRTVCVFCRKSYAYAVNANQMRHDKSRTVPTNVIKRDLNILKPPIETEGWDEIRILDGDQYSIEVEKQKPVFVKGEQYE